MKAFNFYIDFYNLAFLGSIFVGIAFGLMLFLVQKGKRTANRILGLLLVITVIEMLRALNTMNPIF